MNSVPFNRPIVQVVQGAKTENVDSSVMIAIAQVSNQIKALAERISEIQKLNNQTVNASGNDLGFSGLRQTIASLINGSGGNLYKGDVLINGAAGIATTTTVEGDENVIGVVNNDGTTKLLSTTNLTFVSGVSNGSYTAILERGIGKVRVKTDATPIEVGDFIKAGPDARYAIRALPGEPGIFAKAHSRLSSNQSGLINADVNPRLGYQNNVEGRPFVFKAVYDTDGTLTGFSGFLSEEKYFTSADLSNYIKHNYYTYSSDGSLVSMIQSMFDTGGIGAYTIQQLLNYQSGKLEEVIQSISG